MPSFDKWIASTNVRDTSAAAKATEAWNAILDDSTSVVITRNGSNLAAQTVRIEYQTWVTEDKGDMAEASRRSVWVFGVRDHPTVTDTNLQNGDKFVLNGNLYRVRDVLFLPGEIYADGERLS